VPFAFAKFAIIGSLAIIVCFFGDTGLLTGFCNDILYDRCRLQRPSFSNQGHPGGNSKVCFQSLEFWL
jgi:hypothetical protein